MPFSSLANTASSSDALRVASSSDALSQDYMESDDFDTLDVPMLMSSGDEELIYGTDYVVRARFTNGKISKYIDAQYVNGFYKMVCPSGYYPASLYVQVYRSALPQNVGTYGMTATINQGNTDFGNWVTSGFLETVEKAQNVAVTSYNTSASYTNTGISYMVEGNIRVTRYTQRVNIGLYIKKGLSTIDTGSFSFTLSFKQNDGPLAGDSNYESSNEIADNTAQMVEKQDTIIDQIVNVTQTISSQLTAFWNQLAGEFTNLYNKMNEQHQESLGKVDEQIDNDNANTDKVTGAIEAHGNFIIEGLKGLFIPSDEYFKTWFDDMYKFFNDRLGFLMLPVDLLVRFADMYASAGSSTAGFPFPEFKWMDGTVLIPGQTVQFDFLQSDWGKGIQSKLYFVGNLIMIGALLSLMHRKFEEVLRN